MNEEVVQRLAELVGELSELASQLGDDGDRIDVIAGLEKLKAAAAASQLSVVSDFAASQEAANRQLGVEACAARRGVPEQVGLPVRLPRPRRRGRCPKPGRCKKICPRRSRCWRLGRSPSGSRRLW